MPSVIRTLFNLHGLALALAGNVVAQQPNDDPQRMTLTGLKNFAVYARVQLSQRAKLPAIDENFLRSKMEQEIKRAGISIVGGNDVRDGPGAHLSLLYLVLETRDRGGEQIGFAAFSCIQAEQTVTVPRLGRYAYAVVPTWRSCGVLMGDTESYRGTIQRNADEQIARFLEAWRVVNTPRPPAPSVSSPELGMVSGSVKEKTSGYFLDFFSSTLRSASCPVLSPLTSSTACSTSLASTSSPSRTPPGLPGRLMIRVFSRTPAVPRERAARGK